MKIEPDAWYKIGKVAKYLDCSDDSIRRMITKGCFNKVTRVGAGNSFRIWGQAILDYEADYEAAV